MGDWHRTLGVVILVIMAGCGGPAGDADQPMSSVTPAEVPTDHSSATPGNSADDGLVTGSFADPSSMMERHRSVLENLSYTVRSTRTVRFTRTNRTGRWTLTASLDPDGGYLVETERSGSVYNHSEPVRIDFWSDGEVVVEMLRTNDSTTTNIVRDALGNPVPPRTVIPMESGVEAELLTVFSSTTVQSVSVPGERPPPRPQRVVIATGPVGSWVDGSLPVATSVQNLTAKLIIDDRGFVHQYRLCYNGSFGTEPVNVTRTVRYTAIGTTTVDRPEWVGPALNGTPYEPAKGSNASS